MCVGGGGGGSAPAATITDPLQKTKDYQRASARVRKVKAKQGQMDPAAYQRKLREAKQQRKAVDVKYKNKRADKVEDNTQFMWDKVKDLLSSDNQLNLAQDLLNQSNQGLQDTLTQLKDLSEMAADNQQLLQQDAMRQSLLKGAPPPEKNAERPVVGRFRDEGYRPGRTRQDLRIDRTPTSNLTI